jgi:hypothetical protein
MTVVFPTADVTQYYMTVVFPTADVTQNTQKHEIQGSKCNVKLFWQNPWMGFRILISILYVL